VEVIVDVDLAVGAAADKDEPVDLDHVVRGELLDGVPVASGVVRIEVARDIGIDWNASVRCQEHLLLVRRAARPRLHRVALPADLERR
jgi:hypothetical protein